MAVLVTIWSQCRREVKKSPVQVKVWATQTVPYKFNHAKVKRTSKIFLHMYRLYPLSMALLICILIFCMQIKYANKTEMKQFKTIYLVSVLSHFYAPGKFVLILPVCSVTEMPH